jgi:hypothetical protein
MRGNKEMRRNEGNDGGNCVENEETRGENEETRGLKMRGGNERETRKRNVVTQASSE